MTAVLRKRVTPGRSKYGARKTVRDGITFDSVGEANRWGQLKLLERAGNIRGLGEPHPSFPIAINGTIVCKVEMDFAYSENGQAVVEDYKGVDTPVSRLKRKLLAAAYPHLVIRVTGAAAPKPKAPRKPRLAAGKGRAR
ncbi:DUF1064 domain-containing protein [bacterium]|nr:DUF1064 domain-containing protein [bacterium]